VAEAADRELIGIFLMEAWDTLATLEDGLSRFRQGVPSAAALEPLMTVSHRLKGSAALNGFPGLAEAAGALEQLILARHGLAPTERAAAADFLTDLVGLLKSVFDGIGATGQEPAGALRAFRARHPAFFAAPAAPPAAPGGLRAEIERFFAENADIAAYFAPEAAEHLDTMTRAVLALEQGGRRTEELGTLFRAVHTLKGAAYTVGCGVVGDLAHRIEDLLAAVREERVELTRAVTETVLAGIDAIRLLLGMAEGAPGDLEAVVGRTVEGLDRLMPAEPALASAETAAAAAPAGPGPEWVAVPAGSAPPAAAAPWRRPASGAGIRVGLDRLDALMNLVGELVIARSRLDRHLRDVDRVGQVLAFSRTRMAKAVRDFEARHPHGALPRSEPPPGDGVAGLPLAGSLAQLFDELEFDRYDDVDILARSVAELSADLSEVQTQLAGLIRTVSDDTAAIQRLTASLRGEVTRARMVPVGRLFARFARQVREAARTAGKTVVPEVSGEAVEVDNTIIDQVADPLMHLVQNAVTHGIEPEAERRARGKPPQGSVRLAAYHRGGFVHINVEDDGQGIDVEALRAEAVRTGLLASEEAARLSDREALDLMFQPGFSTAPMVTTAAGRGVGLDVVRTNVGRLGGEVEVATEPGIGSRFTLKLPLTLVISDALMVRSGGEMLAIPLNAVRVILRLRPGEIQASGGSEAVRVDGQLVDLLRLDRVLGLPAPPAGNVVPVVVLRAGGRQAALAVDDLVGKEEIVIKPLGAFLDGVGPFAGATISGEGRVILMLDAGRLVALTEGGVRPGAPARRAEDSALPRRPAGTILGRVLLVDDSISVRKFVGHMLERAGFRVSTANDGAEALQRLGEAAVDVVVTDLEMPRVNGSELIEDLRRRAGTKNLPVVVLTTRAGDKHVSLARRLGVQHYVSKPVDERAFVRLIESLSAPAVAAAELTGAAR
jgi:chemosensory pili system protein ChpA (sensor histidine kinase/response regulator)